MTSAAAEATATHGKIEAHIVRGLSAMNLRAPPYIRPMIIFKPNPHKLRVVPSLTEPGRFAWSITRDDVVVRQSARSFGSHGASEADGDTAFREVTVQWQNAR